jgi:predicted ATPase
VLALLADERIRLLTLTAAGGSGKTRLAVQAAAEAVDAHEHGVWWVPLQAVRDPDLVVPAIGSTIGVAGDLADQIGTRRMLLALDNLEQVLEAAPALGDLLTVCPNLRFLVTSREPLRLSAEREYPVPPFVEQEGVGFFLARARAVRSDFQPDEHVLEIWQARQPAARPRARGRACAVALDRADPGAARAPAPAADGRRARPS